MLKLIQHLVSNYWFSFVSLVALVSGNWHKVWLVANLTRRDQGGQGTSQPRDKIWRANAIVYLQTNLDALVSSKDCLQYGVSEVLHQRSCIYS